MTEDGGAPTAAAPVVMGTLGRVEEYEHHKEDWPQYVERLSHFFKANAITTLERNDLSFWQWLVQLPIRCCETLSLRANLVIYLSRS